MICSMIKKLFTRRQKNGKKYELIPSDIKGLYRVKALRDFGNVKVGDIGGYVQSEANLSHDGDCWVYGNVKVNGNARVYVNAKVFGNALVAGNAKVSGNAKVFGNAWVGGKAEVSGNARVYRNAEVSGEALVFGNAEVYGNDRVYGDARVFGNARVSGDAKISGDARVFGNAEVYGDAKVGGDARVSGRAKVTKPVRLLKMPEHDIYITDRHISVGCEQHTLKQWLKEYKKIGRKNGYTEPLINLYYKQFLMLSKELYDGK